MANNNCNDNVVAEIPFDAKLINVILFVCERISYIFLLLAAIGVVPVTGPLVFYSCYTAWCAIVLWLYMTKCAKRNPFNTRMFIDVLLDCLCAAAFVVVYFR